MTEFGRPPEQVLPQVSPDTIDLCIAQAANVKAQARSFAKAQPYLEACLDDWVEPLAPDESLQARVRWCGLFAYRAFQAENALAIGLRTDTPEALEQGLPTLTLWTINALVNDIRGQGDNFFDEAERRLQINQPHLNRVIQGYIRNVFAEDLHLWPQRAVLLVHEAFERRSGFLPRINRETVDLIKPSLLLEQGAGEEGTLVGSFWKEQPHLLSAVQECTSDISDNELRERAWRFVLLTYHHLRVEASLVGWRHPGENGEEQSLPQLSPGAVGAVMSSLIERRAEAFFDSAQTRMEHYQPDYFMGVQQAITSRHPQEAGAMLRPLLLLYEAFEHYGDSLQIQAHFDPPAPAN